MSLNQHLRDTAPDLRSTSEQVRGLPPQAAAQRCESEKQGTKGKPSWYTSYSNRFNIKQSYLQTEMSNRHKRRVGALVNQTSWQRRAVISHPLTEEKAQKAPL